MTDQTTKPSPITPEKVRYIVAEFSKLEWQDSRYKEIFRELLGIAQAYLDECESLKKLLELHTELCAKISWANSLIEKNQRLQKTINDRCEEVGQEKRANAVLMDKYACALEAFEKLKMELDSPYCPICKSCGIEECCAEELCQYNGERKVLRIENQRLQAIIDKHLECQIIRHNWQSDDGGTPTHYMPLQEPRKDGA